MADSRDMYVVHDAFRREFTALPGLIRGAAPGSRERAAVLADHVAFLVSFLHGHHEGEDRMVWPRLLERGSGEVVALVRTMEAQHAGLDTVLTDLEKRAEAWGRTAGAEEQRALAEAASALLPLLNEHLETEETALLPLIDRYLTDQEWKAVGGSSLKELSFSRLKLSFGMILNRARPDQVAIMRDTIPRVPFLIFSMVGPRAYAKHADRVRRAAGQPRE